MNQRRSLIGADATRNPHAKELSHILSLCLKALSPHLRTQRLTGSHRPADPAAAACGSSRSPSLSVTSLSVSFYILISIKAVHSVQVEPNGSRPGRGPDDGGVFNSSIGGVIDSYERDTIIKVCRKGPRSSSWPPHAWPHSLYTQPWLTVQSHTSPYTQAKSHALRDGRVEKYESCGEVSYREQHVHRSRV